MKLSQTGENKQFAYGSVDAFKKKNRKPKPLAQILKFEKSLKNSGHTEYYGWEQ